MVFTMYRTAIGWPVRTKGIYKYVQNVHTGSMKRREISTFLNGDLTADVSTQFSTYIKTLTNKEKFQY